MKPDSVSGKNKALPRSNPPVQEMLEASPDAFYALDALWRFTYVNRQAELWWQRPREDLLGFSFWEIFPELEKTPYRSMLLKAASEQTLLCWESYCPKRGKWLESFVHPASGGGLYVHFRDITRHKQIEENYQALQKSEQQALQLVEELKTLGDNLTSEMEVLNIMHKINSNFILQANLEALYDQILYEAVFFTAAEKGFIQLYDDESQILKMIRGQGLSKDFLNDFSAVKVTGEVCGQAYGERRRIIIDDIAHSPLLRNSPLLKILLAEGVRCSQTTPLISSSGKFVGILSTYYTTAKQFAEREIRLLDILARQAADAIERTKTEDQLKNQNKLLQSINRIYIKVLNCRTEEEIGSVCLREIADLTEAATGLIAILQRDGRLHPLAALPGTPDCPPKVYAEIIREGRTQLLKQPAFLPQVESFLGVPLLEKGKTVGIVVAYNRPGGFSHQDKKSLEALNETIVQVLMRWRAEHALRTSKEQALKLLQELRKADQNKNQFLNTLSHELRNPLASMMMSLSLLKLAPPDSAQALQAQQILERQTAQLSSLVDDLLEVTRISQDKIELKKDRVELIDLAYGIAADQMPMFQEKGVVLATDLSPAPIYLQADSTRLRQIISNLLHNSLKFTDPGGRTLLRVCPDPEKNEAVIEVIDNGRGIKPEILPKLFQPFMQADLSLDRKSGGLGLGLTIVKGMAELHGGSVAAFSEGLGKGAAFRVRLPLPPRKEDTSVRDTACPPKTEPEQTPLRILVIDDIPDVALILSSLLELLGHRVQTAYNGPQALQKAKSFRPEVIFCDIGLPGMNGYELAKLLRQEEGLQETLIIALSGYARSEDTALAKEAGFDRHLAKPVGLETLKKVLAESKAPVAK